MELDSARGLKEEIKVRVLHPLFREPEKRLLGVSAQPMTDDARPRTIAIGIIPLGDKAYKLAIRVQHSLLVESQQIKSIRELARGEVDVQFIGAVYKLQLPWYQQKCRPLRIGCSVGHYQVTAGT